MDKTALEHLLTQYDSWMTGATIAVAVGILGEYAVHFIFEREARRRPLEVVLSILCGVLVLGGVVGECLVASKLSQAARGIQQASDLEVARLNKDAGEARLAAARANERADAAVKRAGDANHLAVEANQKFAPRHFTAKQSETIVAMINGMDLLNGYSYCVLFEPSDLEAAHFGREIAIAIFQTKMRQKDCPITDAAPEQGLAIYYDRYGSDRPAHSFQAALRTAGVNATIVPSTFINVPSQGVAKLEIFIGPR